MQNVDNVIVVNHLATGGNSCPAGRARIDVLGYQLAAFVADLHVRISP